MFKPIEPNTNFVEMEKKWLKKWYEKNGVVKKYLHKNDKSKKYFSFLDGPITANNPMGVHHAWGRTYKDIWQRFYSLLGYKERFQNGFDCQGLWVEVEVEKELGLRSKKDIENLVPGKKKESIAKFVDLCKQRVLKYSAIQTNQSKRLGYFMDWDHSYYTMSEANNYMIWHFLKVVYENGWIYKGHESVPWCPRCQTAISQHEILTEDYKEVVHDSIYFELPIINSTQKQSSSRQEYLLVWTTTPWTIPANIAVAVDETFNYSLVEGKTGDLFWIAKDLVETVFKKDYKRIVKTVKGKELVGLKYQGPFDDIEGVKKVAKANPENFHTVIATDQMILSITTVEGTGLVHTAVSAGTEDFKLGKKYGLPMIPVIGDNADYLPGLGFLSGINAKKHPEIIIDYLMEREKKGINTVFKIEKYKHRYPACWRCKAELVWKVADEWYIAMDKSPLQVKSEKLKVKSGKQNTKTLRQRMVEVAKKIKWMPEFGLERELDWLKNMHDWLISKKNRYWGLALPIYECRKCKNFEVIGSKEELKKRAVSGWEKFEGNLPHKPFIDDVMIQCKKCRGDSKRIDDVGNPWLDAGIVPYSTIAENNQGEPLYLKNRSDWQKWFPVDFITESFPGQFKNWFYSMIAMSTVLENVNPFKTVLGYGTLLGEDGRPMHKSWGNSIEFNEGADKIGVDVMRWMYSQQNPELNMLFGYKKADEVRRQFYLMLWNIYKFFVEYSNLDEFDSLSHSGKRGTRAFRIDSGVASLPRMTDKSLINILDRWLLNRFYWLVSYAQEKLKQYNAKDASLEIQKFVNDISTWYIRRSRDRVWVNSTDSEDKQSFYVTLYYVLSNLSIIISPFIPFISEEIYTNLTNNESVHLANWPDIKEKYDNSLFHDMNIVREIAEAGHRVRKELKLKVRQPLSNLSVDLPKDKQFIVKKYLSNYLELLKGELNIKKIVVRATKESIVTVKFDTKLTPELIKEGKLRDLVRQIQEERKKQGVQQSQTIILTMPKEFKEFSNFIKSKVLAKSINIGQILKVELV